MRTNCENKIFGHILVPGNANHDSHRFLGADKYGEFVRSPSPGKQIPCLVMTEARKEGRREGNRKVAPNRVAART